MPVAPGQGCTPGTPPDVVADVTAPVTDVLVVLCAACVLPLPLLQAVSAGMRDNTIRPIPRNMYLIEREVACIILISFVEFKQTRKKG